MNINIKSVSGYVHSVETFGAVDGPGIRYVVFVQGCPLRCMYCHNPDSWKMNGGTKTTSAKVVADISKYLSFIKNGGVTISGGEPLAQCEFVADIIKRCKKLNLHTAVDTSGFAPLEKAQIVIDSADLILLDIKADNEEFYKKITGQSGNYALAILDYCEKIMKPVWIRHVVVPELTLNKDRLILLAEKLAPYKCIEKVELLPFHKMGEYKWEEIGADYQLKDTLSPTKSQLQEAIDIFTEKGLPL